jgi:hypothetical protein
MLKIFKKKEVFRIVLKESLKLSTEVETVTRK